MPRRGTVRRLSEARGPKLPDGNLLPEVRFREPCHSKAERFSGLISELSKPAYSTAKGRAYFGDSLALLSKLPARSIDLIVTSPPYALLHEKAYGNKQAEAYIDWFRPFAQQFHRVLKKRGSLVLEFGGTWRPGKPIRSLYQFALLLDLAKTFQLAQDFYWYNSAKLPTPAEWVAVRRCRLKDAVTTVWWLSKGDDPKANNRRVLYPYGEAMERLFRTGYNAGRRPSEHNISAKWWGKRGRGAIAPNILVCPNTNSREAYLTRCKQHQLKPHPARFPAQLPRFFIRLLTEIGDVVLDPFAGSNTTGQEAEMNNRYWVAAERDAAYIEASSLRFYDSPVRVPLDDVSAVDHGTLRHPHSAVVRPSAA